MDKRHKFLLRINYFYIINHLDIVSHPEILDHLREKNIILQRCYEEIISKEGNIKKSILLIDTLPKRGPKAFEIFLDALHHGNQNYIKDTLLCCLNIDDAQNEFPNAVSETIDTPDCVKGVDKRIILIINNEFKGETDEREGSLYDVEDLIDFFVRTLQYDLYNDNVYKDLSADNMVEVVDKFAEAVDEYKNGLAVVVIMTHGQPGHFLSADKKLVNVRRILGSFRNKRPTITKSFIFSACRGDREAMVPSDPTSEVNSVITSDGVCSVAVIVNESRHMERFQSSWKMAPPQSIVVYSTQLNFRSYRIEDRGTIFVQSLLSVFKRGYERLYLREMLMEAQTEMRVRYPVFTQLIDMKDNYFGDIKL